MSQHTPPTPQTHPDSASSLSLVHNLVDLYWFTQVVDAGSFSEAAQNHDLSKSSLSRRLSQLETRLGVQLLHRNPRFLSLTSIGSEVYQHTLAMLNAAQKATNSVQHALETPSGKVSVVIPGVLQHWLMPVLAEFLRNHPQVQLQLQARDTVQDMSSPSIDLALSLFEPPADSSQIVSRPLAKLLFANFCSTGLKSAEPLHAIEVSHAGSTAGQEPTVGLQAGCYLLALKATLAGLGYANLPLLACLTGLRRGELKYYNNTNQQRTLFAFTQPQRGLTLAARQLLDHLTLHAKQNEAQGIIPIN